MLIKHTEEELKRLQYIDDAIIKHRAGLVRSQGRVKLYENILKLLIVIALSFIISSPWLVPWLKSKL